MNLKKKRDLLSEKGNFEEIAAMGKLVKKGYDPIYNYAVSMCIESAIKNKDYERAFLFAYEHKDSGWTPEMVYDEMKEKYCLDGEVDIAYSEFKRKYLTQLK